MKTRLHPPGTWVTSCPPGPILSSGMRPRAAQHLCTSQGRCANLATNCSPSTVTLYAWWSLVRRWALHSTRISCVIGPGTACSSSEAVQCHSQQKGPPERNSLAKSQAASLSRRGRCADLLNLMCKRSLSTEDGVLQHCTSCPTALAGCRPAALCLLA